MILFFNKSICSSFMQALFKRTYWLRFLSQLQREDIIKEIFLKLSLMLEVIALDQSQSRMET
ncbi:hypothetical protein HU200_013631 [Digitaria exilis]|uniref:Uncharacterized protein n=1 Tax=Digitaria exilis TaxID=1010633 RepID=A0A835FDB0_9POAL|nr:hypothetical protein HU200_013631 [Digitaria exilis]